MEHHLLQVVSNDKLKSVTHRAVVAGHTGRISIANFLMPRRDTKVQPATELCSKTQPSVFGSMEYGRYLVEVVATNLLRNKVDTLRIKHPVYDSSSWAWVHGAFWRSVKRVSSGTTVCLLGPSFATYIRHWMKENGPENNVPTLLQIRWAWHVKNPWELGLFYFEFFQERRKRFFHKNIWRTFIFFWEVTIFKRACKLLLDPWFRDGSLLIGGINGGPIIRRLGHVGFL